MSAATLITPPRTLLPSHAIRRVDAPRFLEGSVLPVVSYHETFSAASARSIRDHGIDISFARKSAYIQAFFATLMPRGWYAREGSEVVAAAIRTQRPYQVQNPRWLKEIDAQLGAAELRPPEVPTVPSRARSWWLLDQGYDSVIKYGPDEKPEWIAGLINDHMRVVVD